MPHARQQSMPRAARSPTASVAPNRHRASHVAADTHRRQSAHIHAHGQRTPPSESAPATVVHWRCRQRPSVARPRGRVRAPPEARQVLAVRSHRRRSRPRERSRRLSGPTRARTHTRNSGHEEVGSCHSAMQPGRRGRSLKECGQRALEMRSFFRSHRGRSRRFLNAVLQQPSARYRREAEGGACPPTCPPRSAQRGGGSPEGEGGACPP